LARHASPLPSALHADQRLLLNLIERVFAEITTKCIRRGAFTSAAELEDAIHDYLDRHNAHPKPFVWTKTAEVILEEERRALDALEAVEPRY
jgi:hypothetical protein